MPKLPKKWKQGKLLAISNIIPQHVEVAEYR